MYRISADDEAASELHAASVKALRSLQTLQISNPVLKFLEVGSCKRESERERERRDLRESLFSFWLVRCFIDAIFGHRLGPGLGFQFLYPFISLHWMYLAIFWHFGLWGHLLDSVSLGHSLQFGKTPVLLTL